MRNTLIRGNGCLTRWIATGKRRQLELTPIFTAAAHWLDRIDPGAHRRIRGLRLVTAYGIAAMLGEMAEVAQGVPDQTALSSLAGSSRSGPACRRAVARAGN